MSTTTGTAGRASEPAIVRDLACRAEHRGRVILLAALLGFASIAQAALVIAAATARPILVWVLR